MNRFRVLMMLTAFLATTAAVHAQSPQYYTPPSGQLVPDVQPGCPATTWYFQAMQETAATWQRLRAVCSADAACETKAGCAKGCEVAQAPKACCCAKACACCESCKAKDIVRAVQQPYPTTGAPNCLPPQCGSGIVQIMPVQGARIQVVQVAHVVKPVRLVTPDLEAVCERMHHRGDVVVLEGNVLLLCKKHAQPIRIEAQRVLVNMRDGSYTVESDARPVTPTSFGILRTSAVEAPVVRYELQMPAPIRTSLPRAVPVQPYPGANCPLCPAAPATMTPEMIHDFLRNFNFGGIPY